MRLLGEVLSQLVMACSVPNLPSAIVNAIVMTESSGYVYALSGSYDYSSYYLLPKDAEEAEYAIAVGNASLEHEVNISVGLMQVNSWHMRRMGASVATTIDPCNNILIGSSILKEIVDRACGNTLNDNCLDESLRQYNTGRTQPSEAGDAYVRKVRANVSTSESNILMTKLK
jgi:type IV secretion system protein VirB1